MQIILVFDSEPDSLNLIETHLTGMRHRVVGANKLRQALEYAFSSVPDLVIVGVHEGEKDPLEFLYILKKEKLTKDIPILGIYRSINDTFIEKTKKLGISDILSHPILKDDLISKIKKLLTVSVETKDSKIKETEKHIIVEEPAENQSLITFKSGIKKYVLPEIRDVFTSEFLKSLVPKHTAIDIRELSELNKEEIQILSKIILLFGKKKITIIAGRHIGTILALSDLEDTVHLFMSMEEYHEFLNSLAPPEGHESENIPPDTKTEKPE